jgi:predicted exporter
MKTSQRSPWPARSIWLLALLLCAGIVYRTEFRADFSAFLPKHPTADQQVLVEQLQNGTSARVMLVGIEGSSSQSLAALSQTLAATLRPDPLFRRLHNGETSGFEADQAWLFSARYLLSPNIQADRFAATGLRQAIQDSLGELGSSTGLLSKDLFARDPTGEMLTLMDQMLPGDGPRQLHGHWFNAQGTRALLLVETQADGTEMDTQEQAIAHIRDAFLLAQKNLPQASAARLLISGPGVFAVSSRDTIRSEATRLSIISTVLILGLLFAIYRSLAALVLGMLPVLTGALVGVAAVSLGFGMVHGMTLGFGTTLIGEAVDYAIYLFVQRNSAVTDDDFSGRFWPTIRLGVLTSVCGFASLMLSGFMGLAQLGLFSIAGLISAAMVTRWVLPDLLPAKFQVRDVTPLGLRLQSWVRALRRARGVLLLAVVAGLLLLGSRHTLLWNHELGALSPVPLSTQTLDAQLRADIAAPDVRHLLVLRAINPEDALQRCEALMPALDKLVSAGTLAGYEAPCRYLPSLATQKARQQALPTPQALRQALATALPGLPVSAKFLAPFMADVEAARTRPLLQLADVQATSFSSALNASLTQTPTHVNLLIQLRAPTLGPQAFNIDTARVRAGLGRFLDEKTVLLDLKAASDSLYHQYLDQALSLSAWGLCAIVLVLGVHLRSLRRVLAVFLPLVAAVVLVAGGLHLAGIRMNLLHLVGLLLIVAVGSNYALFFDARRAATEDIPPHTLASLLFANLTTVAGFGLLGFSDVPVLQAIGITVGPGAIAALVFSAILSRQSQHG